VYVCALRCFSSFFVLILSFAIVGRVSAPAAAPVPAAACSRCDYSIASGSGSIIVVINGKTCLPFKVLVYFLFGERTHDKSC